MQPLVLALIPSQARVPVQALVQVQTDVVAVDESPRGAEEGQLVERAMNRNTD